ncbi:MAG: tetratricopeptide repeat protein [Hyphomicrobiales bacterium]
MKYGNQQKEMFAHAISEFLKNNYEKSLELLNQILEKDPNHRLALITRGTAHLKLNLADSAFSDFSRAISVDPSYPRAFHMRGVAHDILGNDDEALADFSKAIELDPGYGAAYYSRAALYAKMGKEESATDDIETVTHLTNYKIETFANENNIWRSQHLRLESIMETDLDR